MDHRLGPGCGANAQRFAGNHRQAIVSRFGLFYGPDSERFRETTGWHPRHESVREGWPAVVLAVDEEAPTVDDRHT